VLQIGFFVALVAPWPATFAATNRNKPVTLTIKLDSAFFMGAREDWENRGNHEIFNHREHKDHKALTDQGKRSQLRSHFATKTSAQPAATESGLARRSRRLTQIRTWMQSGNARSTAGKRFCGRNGSGGTAALKWMRRRNNFWKNAAGIPTSMAFDIHKQIERQRAKRAAAPDNLALVYQNFTSGKKLAKDRNRPTIIPLWHS